jgi:hypothetical protein
MARLITTISIVVQLAMLLNSTARAGSGNYEPTHPPYIAEVPVEAKSFYIEFRARNEVGGFGHSFVTLGTIDAFGHLRRTIVVGSMPKSGDDEYWSPFGLPGSRISRRDKIRLRSASRCSISGCHQQG